MASPSFFSGSENRGEEDDFFNSSGKYDPSRSMKLMPSSWKGVEGVGTSELRAGMSVDMCSDQTRVLSAEVRRAEEATGLELDRDGSGPS